ncbi:MAG: TrbC/VirB2 family protein [Chloroflexota bacterium]|nr:TrbC/VirB2 family protein [Chloroflexota bacterium]
MPGLVPCILTAHRLLISFAATGDASQMGDFFKKVYEQLLIPIAAPIGILMFTVGAVMFLLGRRDGVEKMLYAGSALFLIAFGPFIVTKLWEILTGLGGGVTH